VFAGLFALAGGCRDLRRSPDLVIASALSRPPRFLEPLLACAEAHGYRRPSVSYAIRPAVPLSNGAATCCIAGTETAVLRRWGVVGCYGALVSEKEAGFVLKIASECTAGNGGPLNANRWYAHHELMHAIIRGATGSWDHDHEDALWTECPNPFDARPLFGVN
jgi:hypothetical protein